MRVGVLAGGTRQVELPRALLLVDGLTNDVDRVLVALELVDEDGALAGREASTSWSWTRRAPQPPLPRASHPTSSAALTIARKTPSAG